MDTKAREFATETGKSMASYKDSLWNEGVYNLGFKNYTLKEVTERALNLGLDLQGGMHVTLEVTPADILISLAGGDPSVEFKNAIATAKEVQKNSQDRFTNIFFDAFEEANPEKPFTLKIRNTIGSNNLFTNFTSTDGTIGKFDYMAFFNLKKGDGFRENSKFNSSNLFLNVGYRFNEKTKISSEITYLNYLAQQGGGLTDSMFSDNPFQSNRSRNWFELDWLLYSIKLKHSFSKNSNISFNFFGLNASRNSIGFRSNRVSQEDPNQERDLIKGDFNNFGAEVRWVKNYLISKKKSILLVLTF